MHLRYILLLLVALITTMVKAELLLLNDDNYQEALEKHSHIVFNFVTDYCENCQDAKKFWRNVAENYHAVPIAEVDILHAEKLAALYDVCEWPVQKVVENTQILSEIKKNPKNVAMAVNVIKKAITDMHEVSCKDIMNEHAYIYSHVAVYFAPSSSMNPESNIKDIVPQYFKDVYSDERSFMRKFMFMWTRDRSCAPQKLSDQEYTKDGGVALYMKFFDEPFVFTDHDAKDKKFDQWISQSGVDRVGKFDHVAMNMIFQAKKKALILFADPKADDFSILESIYHKAGI